MIADYPALLALADQAHAAARDAEPPSVLEMRAALAGLRVALGEPVEGVESGAVES